MLADAWPSLPLPLSQRDLKPQNLLLATPFEAGGDPNTPPALKIADFGFARALGPQLLAETLCGSPLYMAPVSAYSLLQYY